MTIEDWYVLIEASPLDWNQRLVFADWLEDQNLDDLAKGQRYQIKYQRCPQNDIGQNFPTSSAKGWKDQNQDHNPLWFWVTESYAPKSNETSYRWMWLEDSLVVEMYSICTHYERSIYPDRTQQETPLWIRANSIRRCEELLSLALKALPESIVLHH